MSGIAERLRAALWAHVLYGEDGDENYECKCGAIVPTEVMEDGEEHAWHHAHLAEIQAELVERETAAALDAATETMLKSERWAAFVKREQDFGATRALRKAAQEARERGDIGQDDGPEVWDWLEGIVRRAALSPDPDRGEGEA